MYANRLKVCIDIDNAVLTKSIRNSIDAYKDTIRFTFVKNKDAVTRNSYLLYVCDTKLKAHNIVYTLGQNVFIIWCGTWSDFDFSITNVIAFINKDMPDLIISTIVKQSLDHISYGGYTYLYKYLLNTIINLSPNLIWFKDDESRYTLVNDAFVKVSGKTNNECMDKTYSDIWSDERNNEATNAESEDTILKEHNSMVFDDKVFIDGEAKRYMSYKAPLYDSLGNVMGTCGIAHDYTNFRNMNIELEIILSSIPFPVFLCDKEFNVIKMNSSAESITGYYNNNNINYKEWKDAVFQPVADADSQTIYETKISLVMKQFEILEQEVVDHQNDLRGYFCIFRDVTYDRLHEKVIKEVAMTDPLTGLYNRRSFYTMLNSLLGKALTLLYIDIDNFKYVNDTYGHNKGDVVLCVVANRLKDAYREYKVFRLGGDEFAVIIPEKILANTIVEKHYALHEILNQEFNSYEVDCDISLGINCTDKLHDIDDFIHKADERMYAMKKEHHNYPNYEEIYSA